MQIPPSHRRLARPTARRVYRTLQCVVVAAVQVLVAVVLALNYIHGAKKIVHRDLTPGNIVLGALGHSSEGLRSTKVRGRLAMGSGPHGRSAGSRMRALGRPQLAVPRAVHGGAIVPLAPAEDATTGPPPPACQRMLR